MFNTATGEFDDDEHPLGGDVGEQAGAPINPMPPSPLQAPGPEAMGQPPMPAPMAPPIQAPSPMPAPPAVTPYIPQALPPIPVSRAVTPAESQNLGAIDQNAAAREQNANQAGNLTQQGATVRSKAADQQAVEAQKFVDDRNRIAEESAKRLQERQQRAAADYEEYKKFGIKDPEASQNFATRILKAIVIGMGQYASGINGGPNTALQIITEANKDNIARQKAQQEKLFQTAQKSGKDITEAQQQRDDAFRQLDLKHSAMLESSAAMLRQQLSNLGVPQAQIDANADVQKIEKESLTIRENTLKGIREDETRLAQSDIQAAARAAAAAARKPKGGGGGGGGSLDSNAQLADYAQKNPGDTAGLYTLAAKLGMGGKTGQRAVNDAITQNKAPEGSAKSAQQGAVALRAIDTIEKLNYTPTRDDIQKFLQNGREMDQANEAGKDKSAFGIIKGKITSVVQGAGGLAQSQYDGLSPRARMYFENVTRYMESIGREQSGAAISQSEWSNFYGQYGPQSSGGLEAAKQYARDKLKLSGTSGRILEQQGGSLPQSAGGAPKAADPRAKLAREAISDPKATPREKARALQILRSLGQVDTL